MRTILTLAWLLSAAAASACGIYGADLRTLWSYEALSSDPKTAQGAIANLRAMGPAGLDALLKAHAEKIEAARSGKFPGNWTRIAAAIDAVAKQKDAYASGLYWYTDWEQAKAAAAAQKKPILSLRLLGNLDEEYSCANSRFFRTALYANREVSDYLREHYILHWKSVRPVPRIRIDFGDGRVLERTITGNSIHYVTDSNGKIVDGVPGLYGPAAFLRILKSDDALSRAQVAPDYHRRVANQLLTAWQLDLAQVGRPAPILIDSDGGKAPPAKLAAVLATSKCAVEAPLIRAIGPAVDQLKTSTDDATWSLIAGLAAHRQESKLDASSRAVMSVKEGTADVSATAEKFEALVAQDTVRNEYLFRAKIQEWLADAPAEPIEALNERVYGELFLTPSSDPWLGLAPAETYSALPCKGEESVRR
ncbi:MAG: hypothetical protein JO317_06370 [Verrucomicrobiae bacterium]|nr:hypothetical protein [Verrucomicrobiae bacterium]